MIFCGLSKSFSTRNGSQYEEIGKFWDHMAACCGRENLRGLGYEWTDDTITYVIGRKRGKLEKNVHFPGAVYQEVELPDRQWLSFLGKTEQLPQLYDEIYSDGILRYEIEEFFEDGTCRIRVIRA